MEITYEAKWDKALNSVGSGWDYRRNTAPKSIIVHTTNGNKGTSFESEVKYIADSEEISSHFVISKFGKIVQILDPKYRAWHAGAVINQRFNNNNSIGIEVHYTPGEGLWTNEMYDALTFLCKKLIEEYNINSPASIETHRFVAYPKGRKIDPSGFDDDKFYTWRTTLFDTYIPSEIKYKVIFDNAIVRQGPSKKYKEAGRLYAGDIFTSVVFKKDETNEYIGGINTWAHLTSGKSKNIDVSGLGFIHTSLLKIIE